LHFQVPSMNRLNQTEPATFSILPCWAFFRDSVYIYFMLKWEEKVNTSLTFEKEETVTHALYIFQGISGLRLTYAHFVSVTK
jgi:hypothetical protein